MSGDISNMGRREGRKEQKKNCTDVGVSDSKQWSRVKI